jgi:hypothetical protein
MAAKRAELRSGGVIGKMGDAFKGKDDRLRDILKFVLRGSIGGAGSKFNVGLEMDTRSMKG